MYHAIVRRRVEALFAAVNQGDAAPVLKAFAPRFEHIFLGRHALSGTRVTLEATRQWYARLYRLLPDIHFQVRRITITGGPWKTMVVAEWDESNSGVDGVRTSAHGIHILELRWGRATRLWICPDTVPLTATLDRLTRFGAVEAAAAPISG